MATIINNDRRAEPERAVLIDGSDSGAGWAVAVIILLLVVAGGVIWYVRYHHPAAAPAQQGASTNVNVTLPPVTGGTQPSSDGTPTSY